MRRTRTLVDLCLAILVVYGLRGLIMWSVESEAIPFPIASAAEPVSAAAIAPPEQPELPLARVEATVKAPPPASDQEVLVEEVAVVEQAIEPEPEVSAEAQTSDPLIVDDADEVDDADDDADADADTRENADADTNENADPHAEVDEATTQTKRRPSKRRKRAAATQQRALGRAVYNKRCASCHGGNGKGKTKLGERFNIPSITRTPGARLARAIRHGVPGTRMRPYGGKLSARELKAVTSFARAL